MQSLPVPIPLKALVIFWTIGLLISGYAPYDRTTWLMEIAPTLIVTPILFATYRRFQFTSFAYALIIIHGIILMIGGAYTYARVPMGGWIQEWLHLSRNPYDKIGHFAQGFIPAIIARELLIRVFKISKGFFNAYLVISICLAISAFYELIEWWSALAMGQGAEEFLGTQGDVWDTQSDMFLALIGSIVAVTFFSKLHDWFIRKIK